MRAVTESWKRLLRRCGRPARRAVVAGAVGAFAAAPAVAVATGADSPLLPWAIAAWGATGLLALPVAWSAIELWWEEGRG